MTHKNTLRPALTALAAVIAFSSTSSFAQTADVPADPTTTPAAEPTPIAADPIAPVAEPTTATPVATKATATTSRKTMTSKTAAARSRPAPVRASTTVRTAAAPPVAAVAAPVAQAPAATPLPAPTEIATDPVAQPATPGDARTIDVLPTAGLGGLGLLLLGGAGLAIRSRRRRRAEEAEEAEWMQQQAEAEPEAFAEPTMIDEPQPEPAMAAEPEPMVAEPAPAQASDPELTSASGAKFIGPVADLPEGFDVSRFGPNVQDAYRGPTEDNPSASLKHRLSRASGMDQQERKLDAEVEAATGEPALDDPETAAPVHAPAAKPAVIRHSDGDFILGRADKKAVSTYTH